MKAKYQSAPSEISCQKLQVFIILPNFGYCYFFSKDDYFSSFWKDWVSLLKNLQAKFVAVLTAFLSTLASTVHANAIEKLETHYIRYQLLLHCHHPTLQNTNTNDAPIVTFHTDDGRQLIGENVSIASPTCSAGQAVVYFSEPMPFPTPVRISRVTLEATGNDPLWFKGATVGHIEFASVLDQDHSGSWNMGFGRGYCLSGAPGTQEWKPHIWAKGCVPVITLPINGSAVAGTIISAPMALSLKPNLSVSWQSEFGAINWQEGYYGNANKTLTGDLTVNQGGWVYNGQWGRKDNPDLGGAVRFIFFRNGRKFFGTYVATDGSTKYWRGQRD